MEDKLKQYSANAQDYITRLEAILKEGMELDQSWALYDTLLDEMHIADSVIPPDAQTKKQHFATVITNLRAILAPFTSDVETNFERFKP